MRGWKRTALVVGSGALILAMVVVWTVVDLGTADGVASVVGASAGVVGIGYALISGGAPQQPGTYETTRTGRNTVRNGGQSNTGIKHTGSGGPVRATATDTGDVEADGDGSGANSGIQLD
ncbi:hypothetical protein OG875_18505 [Streptomyces sp. NBC_01498]|uniref:hypothetical protein n=1 Tax=Streptomyces sp. NBC_01498 TaxID=2975870 RepID=UPI002E7BF8DA|nr:hypothetical protein [Streptomyces sp. NBC_01498]WTL26400.1 hypothetical protein OG875_18505 [Streptomyces sp. NBC_01498]